MSAEEEMNQSVSSLCSVGGEAGDALLEVLSRLPVKSLMRFKCVCKHWLSMIKNDRYFIDLHYSQSKTRPVLLLDAVLSGLEYHYLSVFLKLPSEVRLEGGEATCCQKHLDLAISQRGHYMFQVNGLFCFIDKKGCSARIYNAGTREETPWIVSTIKQQQLERRRQQTQRDTIIRGEIYRRYQFGYDPTTKEHKVIAIWNNDSEEEAFSRIKCVCEVLTVGKQNNVWRKIDDVPPAKPSNLTSSGYANGCIYWLKIDFDFGLEPGLVEFNVGTEKFRAISLPKFIIDDVNVRDPWKTDLMELDGCLALLPWKGESYDDTSDSYLNNNTTSLKICVLISDIDWMESTISLPSFGWERENTKFVPIPGTDLIIVGNSDGTSFYYLNWKRKSFSSSKCHITGIPKFLMDLIHQGIPPSDFYEDPPIKLEFDTFIENLFPVN